MAFLANDPNREIDEKNVSMNVVNPTDQGQAANTSSEAQNQPQTGATAGSGTIQASDTQGSQQAPQSAGRRPSEGGKGSSGQFTNIRKYIDANKPQATKMAGAAGAQTQKQSQAIGQQVQQQQDKLEQQIKQNRAKMGQAEKFADQQLWLAGGMQPEKIDEGADLKSRLDRSQENQQRIADYEKSYLGDKYQEYFEKSNELRGLKPDGSPRMTNHRFISPSEQEKINQEREANLQALRNEYFGEGQYGKLKQEDIARFRNLATGQEAFNDVQQMNLAKQQVAARRLQQQAGAAGTEQGRRDLLKQAFGRGGRQYTRGQQGLDDIIVSGSAEARKQLVDQTIGAAEAAQSGIKQAQQQQLRDIAGLQQQGQQFRTGLEEQTTGARKDVVDAADAALKAAKAAREEQFKKFEASQQALKDRLAAISNTLDFSSESGRQRFLSDLMRGASKLGAGTGLDSRASKAVASGPQALRDYIKSEQARINAMSVGGSSWNRPSTSSLNRAKQMLKFLETGDSSALRGYHFGGGGHRLDAAIRETGLGRVSKDDLGLLGLSTSGSFDTGYGAGDLSIFGGSGRKRFALENLLNKMKDVSARAKSYDVEDALQKKLSEIQEGLTLEDFRSGADLTRESVIDPSQIQKYQGLSQLAGRAGDELLAENRGDVLTQEEFDKYLESVGKI